MCTHNENGGCTQSEPFMCPPMPPYPPSPPSPPPFLPGHYLDKKVDLAGAPESALGSLVQGYERARAFMEFNLDRPKADASDAELKTHSAMEGTLHGIAGVIEALTCKPSQVSFVHIYKSAGSSAMKFLQEACPANQQVCFSNHALCGWEKPREATYLKCTDFSPYHPLGVDPKPFTFSMVRDPISRFLSGFYELTKHQSFKGSVTELLAKIANDGFFNIHLRPQYFFLLQRRGSSWEKVHIEYIGTMETISDSLMFAQAQVERRAMKDPMWPFANPIQVPHIAPEEVLPEDMVTLSDEEVRSLCKLYIMDYLVFSLPRPAACTSVFASV